MGLVVFLACASPAFAGGPHMLVGAAESIAESNDPAVAKAEMDKAKLAGLDSIRLAQTWSKGDRALSKADQTQLGNAIAAAQFTGIRVVLSLYPFGSSVTPLTDAQRADFAAFCADVAKRYPYVHDFIVGNEPNLNRFWMPQFGPNGEDVAAPAYEQLLADTSDAIKKVRPHSTVYGGALAPRGVDKPHTGRDTHSPTTFIADLGAAYRASGRQVPMMDAFAFHPYPENSAIGPNFPHPNSSSIGLADYDKLVGLLGAAFDGTAQHGSGLPILYDEFGIETQIPAAKASLYTGTEPKTTKPVDDATQAQYYAQAMQMTFCQPTVLGLLLFHVQDEKPRLGWQSGEYYVDGTPKPSLAAVHDAAGTVHRGVAASCPGMHLTPKIVLVAKAGSVQMTCSLDCTYLVTLDGRRANGKATGGVAKTVVSGHGLAAGRHVLRITATAVLNAGPPGTASLTFTT